MAGAVGVRGPSTGKSKRPATRMGDGCFGTPEAAMKQNVPGARFVIAGPIQNRQAERKDYLAYNAERKAKEMVGKTTNHLFGTPEGTRIPE